MEAIIMILVLSLPLLAGAFFVWFMASGKGKPAHETDAIKAVKLQKQEVQEIAPKEGMGK
jgi:hypothetical protein